MQPLLTALLSLRVGLVPVPTDGALLSIREAAVAAAQQMAIRDSYVREPSPVVGMRNLLAPVTLDAEAEWVPPATIQRQRTERWKSALAQTLNGNQTIANAAVWIASAPVRLKLNRDHVFVGIQLRTP